MRRLARISVCERLPLVPIITFELVSTACTLCRSSSEQTANMLAPTVVPVDFSRPGNSLRSVAKISPNDVVGARDPLVHTTQPPTQLRSLGTRFVLPCRLQTIDFKWWVRQTRTCDLLRVKPVRGLPFGLSSFLTFGFSTWGACSSLDGQPKRPEQMGF
jgi:hypothetical protein